MNDTIKLRPARVTDVEIAAVLLHSAYTHTLATFPLQEEQRNTFIERLEDYFREEGNRFSYQYCQVAEQNSEVVGLILSFGGRDERRLNAAIGRWLEREAQDDEWYIDALAVLKNWSRQGIATRLLQDAEQQARQHHYLKIALNVAQGNIPALSLYQRLHYTVTQENFLYQRPHVRMVKILDAESG
ncbi:MAG TPA: GNAT family N-acetyltransferase [Ktedonobacteraceae bacterium]|nr:GNAT family N-acetyltransferase [Ktedonobacteraceae bacterium]